MELGEMNIEAAMLLMPFESGVALGDEGVTRRFRVKDGS